MPFLELDNVSKYYFYRGKEVHALRPLSLAVEEGEFLTVVGRSGSGKSTLLNIVAGLLRPSSGEVILDGKRIWSLSEEQRSGFRRRMIGQIFQDYKLLDYLDVSDNIRLPLVLDGQQMDESYLDYLLGRLRLTELADKYPRQLSGGEQQRTAMARALASRPRLILADEPTGNLDLQAARELVALLRHFAREIGLTILLVTHDPAAASAGDRNLRLDQGSLVKHEDLASHHDSPELLL